MRAAADETEAEREQAAHLRETVARAAPPSGAPPTSRLGEQLARALTPSARTLAMLGTFLIGLGAVLYLARVVFVPLTFALMLSFLLSPAVTWLERRRLPRALGAALIVLALLGVGGFAGIELASPAADDDAAGLVLGVLVDLERDVGVHREPQQLAALGGAEDQAAVLVDRVVDGDEVHLVGEVVGEPAELVAAQELPALLGAHAGDRLVHTGTVRRGSGRRQGPWTPPARVVLTCRAAGGRRTLEA